MGFSRLRGKSAIFGSWREGTGLFPPLFVLSTYHVRLSKVGNFDDRTRRDQ